MDSRKINQTKWRWGREQLNLPTNSNHPSIYIYMYIYLHIYLPGRRISGGEYLMIGFVSGIYRVNCKRYASKCNPIIVRMICVSV